MIDEEVARILHAAADRALDISDAQRSKLDTLAKALEENEELDEEDIER